MKSKNQRPKYFVATANTILYAAYSNGSFYEIAGRWTPSILTTDDFKDFDNFHPCSLADVRAAFNNIKAHKRDS